MAVDLRIVVERVSGSRNAVAGVAQMIGDYVSAQAKIADSSAVGGDVSIQEFHNVHAAALFARLAEHLEDALLLRKPVG
jgi:hypothetical protein